MHCADGALLGGLAWLLVNIFDILSQHRRLEFGLGLAILIVTFSHSGRHTDQFGPEAMHPIIWTLSYAFLSVTPAAYSHDLAVLGDSRHHH